MPGSNSNRSLSKGGSRTPNTGSMHKKPTEESKVPQMKKVGNFLIDMDRSLGQGQYGKVYLA